MQIPVRFRPAQPGINQGRVTIISDAAPGPDVDPSVPTTVTLTGVGLALQISTPEDFGDVLLCESVLSRTITLSNPGSQDAPFTVTTQGDVSDFSVETSSTTIPAGGTATVTVRYTPTPGQRTIVVQISSPALAQPFQITFTATGVTRPLRISVGSATIDVGRSKLIPIRFTTTPDAGSVVKQIRLQLEYSIAGVEIDDAAFQAQQSGWTWTIQHTSSGATLNGTSALGLAAGTLEVQVPMITYVNSQLSHAITPTLLNAAEYPCLSVQTEQGVISTPYYCAQEARQIVLVGPTRMITTPTSTGDVVITLLVGEDMPYQLDLYSLRGDHLVRIAEGTQRGEFTFVIPQGTVSSGLYLLRLATPLRSMTQSIIVMQ
jgi:hypothetical protein